MQCWAAGGHRDAEDSLCPPNADLPVRKSKDKCKSIGLENPRKNITLWVKIMCDNYSFLLIVINN